MYFCATCVDIRRGNRYSTSLPFRTTQFHCQVASTGRRHHRHYRLDEADELSWRSRMCTTDPLVNKTGDGRRIC